MPYKDIEQRKAHRRRYYAEHREAERLYHKLYCRKYRQEHRDEMNAYTRQWCQGVKIETLAHYSLGNIPQCVHCGITDIDVLCIDHINGGGKQQRERFGLFRGYGVHKWLRKHGFPEGYQTLCANCNMKKETERRRKDYA